MERWLGIDHKDKSEEKREEEIEIEDIFVGGVWNKIFESSTKYVRKYVEEVKSRRDELTTLLERARKDVRKIPELTRKYKIAVVDSSYTPMSLDTYAGSLYLVILGYLIYPTRIPPRITAYIYSSEIIGSEEEEPEYKISKIAKLNELKSLKLLLHKRENNEVEFDVIVRDGDMPPAEVFFFKQTKYLTKVKKTSAQVFSHAKSLGVGVAGIVKRIRSSLLSYKYLNIARTPSFMSDAFISRVLLNPGEYIYIGKYGDIIDKESNLTLAAGYFMNAIKSGYRCLQVLDEYPEFKDVHILYYRSFHPTAPPVKLLLYNVNPSEFVSFCSHRGKKGYPSFLNLIDMAVLTYSTSINLEALLTLALKKASEDILRETKEKINISFAFDPLNRQKAELFYRIIRGEKLTE